MRIEGKIDLKYWRLEGDCGIDFITAVWFRRVDSIRVGPIGVWFGWVRFASRRSMGWLLATQHHE